MTTPSDIKVGAIVSGDCGDVSVAFYSCAAGLKSITTIPFEEAAAHMDRYGAAHAYGVLIAHEPYGFDAGLIAESEDVRLTAVLELCDQCQGLGIYPCLAYANGPWGTVMLPGLEVELGSAFPAEIAAVNLISYAWEASFFSELAGFGYNN